ncbi:MAG: 50S ribosomal protein L2 [Candidatus Methanomethylicia archaeon]|nr:50S ribosomal protein L2 [Candidatus Methanomethylicia archaeon]MCX8169265.1 50S ribosomal protein L2 [Candidatus Methanomethylicia archaeon]MDW7988953.1 50S ribosomal protein L2 [Nitrososphaerota archaeon]
MGKRILVQRKGRGGSNFRSPKWIKVGAAKYNNPQKVDYESKITGVVKELLHDPGRGCPLALLKYENGSEELIVAPEGIHVGKNIEKGALASIEVGNILPIGRIPEGTSVCNIELRPGDGGKLARRSGAYAVIVGHSADQTIIKLPSGKMKTIDSRCRATIGIVAAGGRVEKPFVKAGNKYHSIKRKATKWPIVRGKAMVAASHPHGGGSHPKGGIPVPKTAPPGQKVGVIASRRTGRKKGAPRKVR